MVSFPKLKLPSFSFGGTSVVGLSIGSSSIKIAELRKSGKSWKLLTFGSTPLPDDVIVNREILNPIVVTDSIRALVGPIKLKTKMVCTALSGTSLIIKRMQLDVPNAKELEGQVFWEAEQYLPFDVSEVVMDYQVLTRTKEGKTDLILVAAKRAVVDAYMGVVTDAGLKPKIVDTDFFALQTAYEANYPVNPAEAVAVVDIGASSLKLVVLFGGVPVFTKDSALGGRNLTAEIQKHLNLSYADAEALKTGSQEGGIPQEVNELMNVMSENFTTEIKRALDFYNASSAGAAVSSVVLAGGCAKLPSLPKMIEEILSLPTQVMNPFNSISYDPAVFSPEYIASIAPIAAIPIGLALRAAEKQ